MELQLIPEPDPWLRVKLLALDSVSSPHTRRAYGTALNGFIQWWGTLAPRPAFSRATVHAYRARLESNGLAPSSVNVRLAAIRKLASEAADNGFLTPELASGIAKVKGVRRHGVRMGNWLNGSQAEALIAAPDTSTLAGKRDRAVMTLLIGCGLRRSEAVALRFDHIQMREGRWVIVDLIGKHGRVRSVPMPMWAKAAIDQWTAAAGIDSGYIFRPVNRGDRVWGERISAKIIWMILKRYTAALGMPQLAPHDLRRTFAKLSHKGRAALEQIQLSLGHASIQTTERYLGVQQDLIDAPCDRLALHIAVRE